MTSDNKGQEDLPEAQTYSAVKRALILTNHLFAWAGTEIFALELGGELARRGIHTSLFAMDVDGDFAENATSAEGIALIRSQEDVSFEGVDLIYCQHQVLTIFLDQLLAAPSTPFIAYGHLSPYEPIEAPGPCVEPNLGQVGLCNSEETKRAMIGLGLPADKLVVFPNPAPEAFFDVPARSEELSRILAVSNHFPDELRDALALVERSGVRVTRIGRDYEARRITPRDFADHDAVVSIGKTVQYALAARRPAFVYDRFAGPGWLSKGNFDAAAKANFSGRCTGTPRSAASLAAEITDGFSEAYETQDMLDANQFRLSEHVDRLLAFVGNRGRPRASDFSEEQIAAMHREREMLRALLDYRSAARRPSDFENAIISFGARNRFARALIHAASSVGPASLRPSLANASKKIKSRRDAKE